MAVEAAKPVMVIGIDDSEHAVAALEWTLDKFFSRTVRLQPFKLVVVHVKPSPDVFVGVSGPGRSVETYQALDDDLKRKAARTIELAREICAAKSVTVEFRFLDLPYLSLLNLGLNGYELAMILKCDPIVFDGEFEVEEGDARYV
ncbi:hypothetical protein SDJN02_24543, partial [Cucurbita argyrosperma subsp. argyrosperma]